MGRFKQYLLLEKTFNINKDVDYIFNTFFKDRLKKIRNKEYNLPTGEKVFATISSEDLKSKEAIEAHELNPVFINIGILKFGSYYDPVNKKIGISLNISAIEHLKSFNYDIDAIKKQMDYLTFKQFSKEFEVSNIKTTIYHELSHWLSDTFHNKHIEKLVRKSNRKVSEKGFKNFQPLETDAQIHAIKQLKRDYKKDWNNISFFDLIEYKPAFMYMLRQMTPKEKGLWLDKILKRMYREKLLGNEMKKINRKAFMLGRW